MALSIRIPDALDFTAYRLAVGDTTALITKITNTQADLESFSQALNSYTQDLETVAATVEEARDITVQTSNSVNLPNAAEQPGTWLRAQADGSYALDIVSHSDIAGLADNYLSRSGGSVSGHVAITGNLSVNGIEAVTLSGGTLIGELKADAGLTVTGYPVITRDPLTDGFYAKWDATKGRMVSTQVQWDEVQQKPDLVVHATLTGDEYLKWDAGQNKAISSQIQWAEVQQKPTLLERTTLTDGQPVRWDAAQGKAVTNPIQWSEIEQPPQFSNDALPVESVDFTYDADGNIQQINQQINGKTRTILANYAEGNLQSLTDTYDGIARTETISYNASGQMSGISISEASV